MKVNRQRGRLIERQLAGLAWLEGQVAEDPSLGDPVGAWLAPSVAGRLASSGIPTLFTLAERINGMGEGWHRGIPGIGANKAARLVRWVSENERAIGVPVGAHVARRRAALTVSDLAAVVPVVWWSNKNRQPDRLLKPKWQSREQPEIQKSI